MPSLEAKASIGSYKATFLHGKIMNTNLFIQDFKARQALWLLRIPKSYKLKSPKIILPSGFLVLLLYYSPIATGIRAKQNNSFQL